MDSMYSNSVSWWPPELDRVLGYNGGFEDAVAIATKTRSRMMKVGIVLITVVKLNGVGDGVFGSPIETRRMIIDGFCFAEFVSKNGSVRAFMLRVICRVSHMVTGRHML